MEMVVQWVRTLWTKQSRGGANAARRNRIPVAFSLPGHGKSPASRTPLVHEVVMREEGGFCPHATVEPQAEPAGVLLHRNDDDLRVELVVSPWGMPSRTHRPAQVVLRPGEWLRWQVNYRFTNACDGSWSYRLDTLNLAYGGAPVDVFLGRPVRFVDERRHLR